MGLSAEMMDSPADPAAPVSVVIPTLNAAATLERAIRSARAQTRSAREIIVVDDGSRDGTPQLLEALAGADLRVLRHEVPAGASAARNAGIMAAESELIAFLDADDEWVAEKLELQARALAGNPRAVFASCGSSFIMADGRRQKDLYAGVRKAFGAETWRALLACNFVATPSVLAYRRALLDAGLFDTGLKVAEDQDMWIKLASSGEMAYVDRPLVLVHQQPNSLSAGQRIEFFDRYTLPMIRAHLERLSGRLSRRDRRLILAERYARIGRGAFAESPWEALGFLLRGSLLGYEPLTNMAFIAAATPPGRRLKEWLRA